MSPGEVWTLLQYLATVAALAWCLYLQGRLERTERRLAESRIDTFALVDLLEAHALEDFRDVPLSHQLRDTFPHLYDLDEREADERAAERAS